MIKLYLARHGETDMNTNRIYCGWLDVSINSRGIRQCEILRDKLSDVSFDRIITSSLDRSVQSAKIISGAEEEKLQRSSSLNEINFGEWEGKTSDYIRQNYYEDYRQWAEDWKSFCFPKGESFEGFKNRVYCYCEELFKLNKDETLLITAHEGSLKVVIMVLLGLDDESYWKLKLEPGCYSLIELYDINPVLKYINK